MRYTDSGGEIHSTLRRSTPTALTDFEIREGWRQTKSYLPGAQRELGVEDEFSISLITKVNKSDDCRVLRKRERSSRRLAGTVGFPEPLTVACRTGAFSYLLRLGSSLGLT